jgi:molybdenum cofactor cytidylyltransferase
LTVTNGTISLLKDALMNRPYAAAIILAAGSSSRMGGGRHKLLLPLNDRPVLAHVIDATRASQARPIYVVLGHQAENVRTHIVPSTTSPDIFLLENPDYLQGMSTSIRHGIQALMSGKSTSSPGSALIVLGDQPMITPRVIDTLIETWRSSGKRVVAPLYEGKRGSPVLFDASLFPELLQVTGDEGGRSVLERHRDELALVEAGNTLVNYDVDTWEAYQEVVKAWENRKLE